MSTDLETRTPAELATPEDIQALADEIKGDIPDDTVVIPQLKLAQGQSDVVQDGTAEPGEFAIPLSGDALGDEIDFVVASTYRGRFWSVDGSQGRGTRPGEDTVPWAEHPCYGEPFVTCADAEEQYRLDVNDGKHEWGEGPNISTTFNFIGYVVGDEAPAIPVRLSLMRTGRKAGEKIETFIKRMFRQPWENTIRLKSDSRQRGRNTYHVVVAEKGRAATPEEQQQAISLALSIKRGAVDVDLPDTPEDQPVTPPADRDGALDT